MRHTHGDNVSADRVTEGEVASDSDEDVYEGRNTYAGDSDGGRAEVGVVANFVQNREHLRRIG